LIWGGLQLIPISPSLQRVLSPQAAAWRLELGAFEQSETVASRANSGPPESGLKDFESEPSTINETDFAERPEPFHVGSSGVSSEISAWDPLSVFPVASQRACALLLLATVTLLLASLAFYQPRAQRMLHGAILASGCGVALFGIVHKLTSNGLIYWQYTYNPNATPFGPFVHRNNAAGYLNLALAAGVYLAVRRLAELQQHATVSRVEAVEDAVIKRGSVEDNDVHSPPWQNYLDARLHGLLAAIVLLVGGVAATASRGGILSLSLGIAMLALLATWNRRFRLLGIGMLLLTSLGWGIVVWVSLDQPIITRLETLGQMEQLAQNVRVDNWQVGLRAAGDFRLTGSGYGTYRYAYLPYEDVAARDWFLHAENVFVETLLEGGVPGLFLLILGIGFLGYHGTCLAWSRDDPRAAAAGLATLFLLATQLPQSCLDLGIYLPANLLTMAALAGSAMGHRLNQPPIRPLSQHDWSPDVPPEVPSSKTGSRQNTHDGTLDKLAVAISGPSAASSPPGVPRRSSIANVAVGAALGMGLIAGWWVASGEALTEPLRFARPSIRTGTIEGRAGSHEAERVSQIVSHWESVVQRVPGDAEARARLAAAWIQRYQTSAAQELIDNGIPGEQAAQLTSLATVEAQAMRLALDGEVSRLAQLRQHPYVTANLLPARQQLEQARRHCPLIGSTHLLLARLTFVTEDPRRNELHLRRFATTAPQTAETLLTAGLMHLAAERTEIALPLLREAWEQAPLRAGTILSAVRPAIPFEQLIAEVIPPHAEEYVRVARDFFSGVAEAPYRHRLLQIAEQAAVSPVSGGEADRSRAPASEGVREYVQAAIRWESGDHQRAIANLEKALQYERDRAEWHYQLSRWHVALRDFPRALPPARRAVALQVDNPRYRVLLRHITERLRQQSHP
jgi:O-antigen ligase/tetratricopeptide (TPR) repeat protein